MSFLMINFSKLWWTIMMLFFCTLGMKEGKLNFLSNGLLNRHFIENKM